ncbi:MAG TPA: methyltransferase domain-containing protein [Terriglobales bacterium]|nr:methyltransferase domain-containing protein [Terriglobales bacterium]
MNRLHRWYCRSTYWNRTIDALMPWAVSNIALGDQVLEVGPGPGLSTNWLLLRSKHLTCLEIDWELARLLQERLAGLNVTVLCGSAIRVPFQDCSFNSAVCFTVLHHISSPALQDRLFAEMYRVLRPGGTFVGTDSLGSLRMSLFHIFDTMVLVDPATMPARLQAAGFRNVEIETRRERFRFLARR